MYKITVNLIFCELPNAEQFRRAMEIQGFLYIEQAKGRIFSYTYEGDSTLEEVYAQVVGILLNICKKFLVFVYDVVNERAIGMAG